MASLILLVHRYNGRMNLPTLKIIANLADIPVAQQGLRLSFKLLLEQSYHINHYLQQFMDSIQAVNNCRRRAHPPIWFWSELIPLMGYSSIAHHGYG